MDDILRLFRFRWYLRVYLLTGKILKLVPNYDVITVIKGGPNANFFSSYVEK